MELFIEHERIVFKCPLNFALNYFAEVTSRLGCLLKTVLLFLSYFAKKLEDVIMQNNLECEKEKIESTAKGDEG